MIEVFKFWINHISLVVNWIFKVVLIPEPRITLGMFLLGFAFLGVVLYFIIGTDFFPGHINISSNSNRNSNDNGYQPRHARKGD